MALSDRGHMREQRRGTDTHTHKHGCSERLQYGLRTGGGCFHIVHCVYACSFNAHMASSNYRKKNDQNGLRRDEGNKDISSYFVQKRTSLNGSLSNARNLL